MIKVTLASGTNQIVTVDYGYRQEFGGNRRYGTYRLTAADTNTNATTNTENLDKVTANTVMVDDRDVPLFNNLIGNGTVTVTDAAFGMVKLDQIGTVTVASGTASVAGSVTGLTGGYDIKVTNTTDDTAVVVTKGYTNGVLNGTFTVAVASGTTDQALTVDYAVLTYNDGFQYVDEAYDLYKIARTYNGGPLNANNDTFNGSEMNTVGINYVGKIDPTN